MVESCTPGGGGWGGQWPPPSWTQMVPSPVGPTAATPQMWWPVLPSAPKWTPRRLLSTPSWSTAGASLHPPSPNLSWFYSVSAAPANRGKLGKLGRPRGTTVASGSFGTPPLPPGKGHSGCLWESPCGVCPAEPWSPWRCPGSSALTWGHLPTQAGLAQLTGPQWAQPRCTGLRGLLHCLR